MGKVRCIFCAQRRARAKEHLWPEWLLKMMGEENRQIDETHYAISGEVVDRRRMFVRSLRYGKVCENCNGGWMSELEARSKPIIARLVDPPEGAPSLSEEEASTLALWTFKSAIVRNIGTNYRRIVPAEHFRYLYENRSIPPGVFVDLGLCPTHSGLTGLQSQTLVGMMPGDRQELFETRKSQIYNVILAIGPLLLRTINVPMEGFWLLADDEAPERSVRLHPREVPHTEPHGSYKDMTEFEMSGSFRALPESG